MPAKIGTLIPMWQQELEKFQDANAAVVQQIDVCNNELHTHLEIYLSLMMYVSLYAHLFTWAIVFLSAGACQQFLCARIEFFSKI